MKDERKTKEQLIGELRALRQEAARHAARVPAEQSSNFQARLLDNISDAIVSTDLSFVIQSWNTAAEKIYGWTAEEVLGKKFWELTKPIYPDTSRDEVVEQFFRDGIWKGEVTHLHKDGTPRNILGSITVLEERAGESAGIVSVFHDITLYKQAQIALRQSEQRFRDVFENSTIGMYRTTPAGQIVIANQALLNLLGFSSFEELAKRDLEKAGFESQYSRSYFKQRIENEGRIAGLEYAWEKADGTKLYIRESAWLVYDDLGNIQYYEGTVEDINERVRADQSIKAQARLLDLIFEHSQDSIVLLDKDYNFVRVSQSYAEASGRDIVEFSGRNHFELYPSDFKDEADHVKATKRNYRKYARAFIYPDDPEQRVTYWDLGLAPILDAQGEVELFIFTLRDVSEYVWTEQALKNRADAMTALHQTVLEITAPHELHDLLQSIVSRAVDLLGANSGGLYLCDPAQRAVRCVISYNTPQDYTGIVLPYGEGVSGKVAESGETLVVEDYRTWSGRAEAYEHDQPFEGVIGVPMIWKEQVIGVIAVLLDIQSVNVRTSAMDLLTLFAKHAAIAVANAQLLKDLKEQAEKIDRQARLNAEALTTIALATADREIRMAGLKKVIKQLRMQLKRAGIKPVADDPGYSRMEDER